MMLHKDTNSRYRSFHINVSWNLLGSAFLAACQWGVLIVLARLGSTEMIGVFSLSLALVTPIFLLFDFHLKSLYLTDIQELFSFPEYLYARLATTGCAFVVILLIAQINGAGSTYGLMLTSLGLAKCCQSISNSLHGLLHRRNRMAETNISLIIQGILTLSLAIAGMHITRDPLSVGLAVLVASALTLFLVDLPLSIGLSKLGAPRRFALRGLSLLTPWPLRLQQILSQGVLLSVTSSLLSLSAQSPRFALAVYLGEKELGVFAALMYITVVYTLVTSALGNAATPELARHYASAEAEKIDRLVKKMLLVVVLLGLFAVVAAAIGGESIARLCYGELVEYPSAMLVLLFATAAVSSMASVLGYTATAARMFYLQPLIATVSLITGAASSFTLVPSFGVYGAVMSLAISQATVLAGYFLVYRTLIGTLRRIDKAPLSLAA